MKTLGILLAAALAVAPIAPAAALDRVLPAPRIKDNGDVRLSDDLKIGRFQGGKFIMQGDGSEAGVLSMPGGTTRSLADRFSFKLSGLDNMPDALVAQVTAVTDGSAADAYLAGVPSNLMPDVTTYLNSLISRRSTELPCGTYRITDTIVVPTGRGLDGLSPGCVRILVGYKVVNGNRIPDFNASAASVLSVGADARLRNIEITLAQPNVASRSQLVTYPKAVDVSAGAGSLLEHVRVAGAIDGIWCQGNCGAANWIDVKVGAIGRAFHVDGALDFLKGTGLHAWPYGFTTTNLLAIYNDGLSTCFEGGQIEAIAVDSLSCAAGKVNFFQGTAGYTFGTIGSLNLDAPGSPLLMSAGQVSIGTLYSTKNAAVAPILDAARAIVMTGGRLTIGSADIDLNGSNAAQTAFVDGIQVSGGLLTIGSGNLIQRRGEARAIYATGGKIVLGAVNIDNGNVNGFTRTAPMVEQTGSGGLDLGAASFARKPGDGGLAVKFNTDNVGNRMNPAQLHGWAASITQRSVGAYGDATLTLTLDGSGAGVVAHGFPTANGTNGNLKIAVTAFAVQAGQPGISVSIPAANVTVDPTNVNINGLGSAYSGAVVYVLARPTGL